MVPASWLKKMIGSPESEFLDFKRSYSTENSDIVHDILCLANSNSSRTRYLIYGIEDKTRVVCGVESDPNRKTSADLMNILYNAKCNHMPAVTIKTLQYEGHDIDVVVIRNLPEKPYLLTKDYRHGSKTVRAGVIYTRNGDTNTPIDGTADDLQIERMFRERLGIDKSPIERAHIYLKDVKNWAYGYNETGLYFFYQPFPEFTLAQIKEGDDFDEPWSREFPDGNASRDELFLKYHSTRLTSLYVAWVDGARLAVVFPNQKVLYPKGKDGDMTQRYISYFYVKASLRGLCQEMINAVYPQQSRFYLDGIFSQFDSEEEAALELSKDLDAGIKKYTFYKFDHTTNQDLRFDSKGTHKLIGRRSSRPEAPRG